MGPHSVSVTGASTRVMDFPYSLEHSRMKNIASNELTTCDPSVAATGAIMDSPKTPASPKQEQTRESCLPSCPVCGGRLIEQRGKLVCSRCHTICETCCEGGRG
jgi:hypothetical protein